jgi:hypothetical protein
MQRRIMLALLCVVSSALYLGFSYAQLGKLSFPLDDAWIHLTFARNLALHGEFAFVPGQISAGSTSPFWTILLAPGFLWPFGPESWTYLLGVILLFGVALLTWRITQLLFPGFTTLPFAAAIIVALDWHLNWAAFSGMETLLVIALCFLMLEQHLTRRPVWIVGLLGGLAVVTRPESIILVGLVGLHMLVRTGAAQPERVEKIIHRSLMFACGCALPLIPYVALNWVAGGSILPNTFFAKQAEYAILLAQDPFTVRLANLITVTLVGAQVLLVPGFLFAVWLIYRNKRWDAAILCGWWLLVLVVYALRLPVTYQHGRYEIPVIPALEILGLWGSAELALRIPAGAARRILTRVGLIAFPVVLIVFWLRGAAALANDSVIIDCIDVQTALWLTAYSQPSDTIAMHDVGAAGYYLSNRRLLDLAGLITPDVIPFVRDEARLAQYIRAHKAAYLVTSAAWHPHLIQEPDVSLVFEGTCPLVTQEGGYSIGVYRIAYH